MSSIGSLLMGQKQTPATVQDTTASQYQGMRDPLSQALLFRLNGNQGYQGQYAAGASQGEMSAMNGVAGAANGVGGSNAGADALARQSNGQMNPFSGLSGGEQFGLQQLFRQAYGQNPLMNAGQQMLSGQINGQMNPFAGAIGPSGAEMQGLGQIQNAAFGPNQLQDGVNKSLQSIVGGANPMTDQLIASAQRPILQNFSDQALAERGLYTGAGQQVQGEGSSPFAMASARLAGNTQNAMNDAALGVTNQAFNQQLQGIGMAQQQPGLQMQNMLAGQNALAMPRTVAQQGMDLQNQAFQNMQGNQLQAANLAGQQNQNQFQNAMSAFGAAGTGQNRASAAYENSANRQVQAGSDLNNQTLASQMAQVQAQMQNLQAQGLPRSIEQQGLTAGLGQYNQQQAQLLQLMQLMGGMTNAGSVVVPGMQGKDGMIQSGMNAFLGGMGQGMSDRRAKKDVQRIGETNGVPLYRFNYLFEDDGPQRHVGVMADEVEHIPGAVIRNAQGLAYVNYDKVFAHGGR